ncbi:25S rRNA (cytosine-C(5))-methyltransferase NSUN5-like isoform X1 [Syzygium oleosum]|uniref:25S rRNA (cytosine-C(5))-methyltransferase NSUN5-like isoform X1 n=1 Tax=Syzygium oleosum TaxID=219896 RepID=UPI0024BABC8E|nr:25S rRNA (cytosine-C(5))-methyltransferase NSUN5-like isoform X1 [Syzygium oleosum]
MRPSAPSAAANKADIRRLSNAERSAYFARREAAKVLRCVLQGDARRRAVGSVKSLVYSPSVRNKRATFALVCQTLKHLPIIKKILEDAHIVNSKWKRKEDLLFIATYDVLFGQAKQSTGDAEEFIIHHKIKLQSALEQLLSRKKVNGVDELTALYQKGDTPKPRYVRVNTLKLETRSAMLELGKLTKVQKDNLLPDLLILPAGTDLHDHPLVLNGSVFMQGKASCMVAAALCPEPGWVVLDACSAPGNKTVHLAALMRDKGKIVACELNKQRVHRLEDTIRLSGASNIHVVHGDFLNLTPSVHPYNKVRAILLDPSCSGSGTSTERLDHLLPSYTTGHAADGTEIARLNKLAAFQKKALTHALSFPAVERVVYSTCSVHQIENEDVVQSILPLAASHGFRLAAPLPQWTHRGLPVFEGAEKLLRTDPVEDKEGFFIALFVKEHVDRHRGIQSGLSTQKTNRRVSGSTKKRFVTGTKLSRLLFYSSGMQTKTT